MLRNKTAAFDPLTRDRRPDRRRQGRPLIGVIHRRAGARSRSTSSARRLEEANVAGHLTVTSSYTARGHRLGASFTSRRRHWRRGDDLCAPEDRAEGVRVAQRAEGVPRHRLDRRRGPDEHPPRTPRRIETTTADRRVAWRSSTTSTEQRIRGCWSATRLRLDMTDPLPLRVSIAGGRARDSTRWRSRTAIEFGTAPQSRVRRRCCCLHGVTRRPLGDPCATEADRGAPHIQGSWIVTVRPGACRDDLHQLKRARTEKAPRPERYIVPASWTLHDRLVLIAAV